MSVRNLNLGAASLSTPAVRVEPARLDDDNDLPAPYKSLWANTSGSARVIPLESVDPVTVQVLAGCPAPFAVRRVLATGTTADLLGVLA